jgi:hypothetical protein
VLGHHISSNGIEVYPAKIKIIIDLPSPQKQKDVGCFLIHASYYKRFIKYLSKIVSPIFALLTKHEEFQCAEYCQASFEETKQKIMTSHVLRGPYLLICLK